MRYLFYVCIFYIGVLIGFWFPDRVYYIEKNIRKESIYNGGDVPLITETNEVFV